MIANVVRSVGKIREVGFQPCVVIILGGLEGRDFGLFVLFIACSVVTTIDYAIVSGVDPPRSILVLITSCRRGVG